MEGRPTFYDFWMTATERPNDLRTIEWLRWLDPEDGQSIFHKMADSLTLHPLLPALVTYAVQEDFQWTLNGVDSDGMTALAICVDRGFIAQAAILLKGMGAFYCHLSGPKCPFRMIFHNDAYAKPNMDFLVLFWYYTQRRANPGYCQCMKNFIEHNGKLIPSLEGAERTVANRKLRATRSWVVAIGLLHRSIELSKDLITNVLVPALEERWREHLDEMVLGKY